MEKIISKFYSNNMVDLKNAISNIKISDNDDDILSNTRVLSCGELKSIGDEYAVQLSSGEIIPYLHRNRSMSCYIELGSEFNSTRTFIFYSFHKGDTFISKVIVESKDGINCWGQ